MPETEFDRKLEQLLAYSSIGTDDTAGGDDRFVVDVMHRVARQRRTRQLILLIFGVIGALFGAFGAFLLSDGINHLFAEMLPGTLIMQAALITSATAAFYVWFMGDDLPLES